VSEHLFNRTFRLILAICLVVYIFSAKGYTEASDTFFSLETAQSIVNHGRLDIPPEEHPVEGSEYTLEGPDGRSYSKYGIGLPIYYIPWVAASNVLSTFTHSSPTELAGFLISFASIPFALLTLVLFARLLKLFGVNREYICLLSLALGLGTLRWRYAVYDFSEGMQMALLLLAVYGVVRATPKSVVGGGAGFAALILVKLVYLALFPLFPAYLMMRRLETQSWIRVAALFTLPVIFSGSLLALLNTVRFGNPLESGYGSQAHMFIPFQMLHTVPQLLGSLDKGLFIYCPVLVLGIPGWREFALKRRAEAVLCGGLLMGNLVLAAAWYSWQGGWSAGPRLLVPAIPLWLLPAAFWLQRRQSRARVWAAAALTMVSIMVQIPVVLVKDQEVHQIKEKMLTAEEQRAAPPEYVTSCILLWHKLTVRNEIYRTSELHIAGDHQLDLTRRHTMIGLNVWTEHVARQLKKPALRWLPLVALFLIGYLALKIGIVVRGTIRAQGPRTAIPRFRSRSSIAISNRMLKKGSNRLKPVPPTQPSC
jgi:hypothetical protein